MKAMILCAGLGTRLRPWTLHHPKALVPVGGVPMLKRVSDSLADFGMSHQIINIHHFGEQVEKWVEEEALQRKDKKFNISDERELLMNTGGALVKIWRAGLMKDEKILVHNVDILTDIDLGHYVDIAIGKKTDVLLLVNGRDSSRHLIFDEKRKLHGWHNVITGEYKPKDFMPENGMFHRAFTGIYFVSDKAVEDMYRLYGDAPFPIMDYFLSSERKCDIEGIDVAEVLLIDIGKPETLRLAEKL